MLVAGRGATKLFGIFIYKPYIYIYTGESIFFYTKVADRMPEQFLIMAEYFQSSFVGTIRIFIDNIAGSKWQYRTYCGKRGCKKKRTNLF